MEIRLDKYLADMSAGTRSEVKKYIKAGRVQVDQFCEKDAARKIDPGKTGWSWTESRYRIRNMNTIC